MIVSEDGEIRFVADGPRIERSVTLRFLGDWGGANFTRVAGWLTQEFCDRAGPYSRVFIGNSNGQADTIRRVHRGEADLAITTPTTIVHAALKGEAIYQGEPAPGLRALGVIPQRDILVLALASELGIRSYEDLRQRKPAIKIATSADDGTSHLGYMARRMMEAHGISEADLNSWGGGYVNAPRPELVLELMREGLVDGVIMEAIGTPWWVELADRRNIEFLSAEERPLQDLERRFGWRRRTLPANMFKRQSEPVVTLDYAHFVVFVREDMHEDIAHVLTWCLVETRELLEKQYRHLDPERTPVSYPLDPAKMARTPLPLHPGAERYYRSAGLL
jgi:uncharacterized protein